MLYSSLCGFCCLSFLGDVCLIWQADVDTCQKELAFLLHVIPKASMMGFIN